MTTTTLSASLKRPARLTTKEALLHRLSQHTETRSANVPARRPKQLAKPAQLTTHSQRRAAAKALYLARKALVDASS